MILRNCCPALVAGLLLVLAGCGHYTIVFEVEEVINTDANNPDDDRTRDQLAVDIVCLTKEDVQNHREIANGTMRANAWFAARDRDNESITIAAERIYALRPGDPSTQDTRKGDSLLSVRESGKPRIEVSIHHPQSLASAARIAIYGRFHRGNEVSNVEPLLIKPPTWDKEILVKVGRTTMTPLGTR
ncbi:MAG TPA: hypothetical protein VM487_07335 [Phycisphaerae bacterium]|nr:hypothetical protein [Phycisphaerae bacterium]